MADAADEIHIVCRKACTACGGTGRTDAGSLADGTLIYGTCLTCRGDKYVDETMTLVHLAALLNDLGPRYLHPEEKP